MHTTPAGRSGMHRGQIDGGSSSSLSASQADEEREGEEMPCKNLYKTQ